MSNVMRKSVAPMLGGAKITLREATEADRRSVFEWLAHSDLTPSMMGPPQFPERSIPTWEEFCADYGPHYFDDSPPYHGRCFIILVDGAAVGVICHNELRPNGTTDMDIWLKSEAECGKGSGTDALRTLADYLHHPFGITRIAISPSRRNVRAIAAYKKAGFQLVSEETHCQFIKPEEMEYPDNVVLAKTYA